MTRDDVRRANAALNTLDDLARSIFSRASGPVVLQYPFGGNCKRDLTPEQSAIIFRELYDAAAKTLDELGVAA
jgi:hypothetical protein